MSLDAAWVPIREPDGSFKRSERRFIAKGSVSQAANIARLVEAALQPAPVSAMEAWIAELSVLVPRRAEDDMTEELRMAAYVSRLAAYPADVARDALLGRTWPFFPSWAELEAVCEEAVADRRLMLDACHRGPAAEPPTFRSPEPEKREEISPEVMEARRLAAQRILDSCGFTERRFHAVQHRRMARSAEELDAITKPPERSIEEIVARPYTDAERARMAALRPQPAPQEEAHG